MSLSRIVRALRWLILGTPPQRRRVRQELARISAGLFGNFPLSDDYKLWREDRQFLRDFQRLSPNNAYSQDRKWVLREYTRLSNRLPGDMAECGCYQGASSHFILQASLHGDLFLFDSFEGLSTPESIDRQIRADVMPWNAGDLQAGEQLLRDNLGNSPHIHIMKGWIPTRFAEVAERRFRLVHIDVDLYQPTRDSLEFFYPRLIHGGVIVLDDYGFLTCPGATRAADEFVHTHDLQLLHLPTGQGIITKCPVW